MRARQQNNKSKAVRSMLALAAAAALGPMAVTPASAATCTWNSTNGNWNELAKWLACVTGNGNPAGAPGAADTANIGAAGVVTINTGQQVLNLNNAGQITIDAFGLNLVGGGSTANTGVINVGGASTANLGISAGHNLNNTGGVINVAAGSVVNQFGSSVTGGTINTTGSGALVVFSSAANFLSGVTLNGVMDMASIVNSRQRVAGGMTLGSGTINLNSNGILSFEDTSTLAGTGAIVFGTTGAGNSINLDGNGTTTFAAGITVRGHSGTIGGQINIGGTQTLLNNGVISADVNGGTITLTESAVTNNNRLEARNSGTLVLGVGITNGAAGTILADNGVVLQSGARIIGGTINSANGGVLRAVSSVGNYLDNTTLAGVLDMSTVVNSRQRVVNGLTLTGTVNINGNGILSFEDTSTLGGTGTIVLGSIGAGNRIDLDSNGTTTFGSGVTVRGENGTIGQQINIGGTQTLANNGLISADVAGGTITITESAVVNNGTLQAINGGRLVLNSNVTGGATGQIVAGAGSTVIQNGVTISGIVNTSGGGLFSAISSAGNFLTNVTLNGNLDMASIVNSRERVSPGGLVLNGVININNNGILSFEGDGALTGNGTIVFGAAGPGNRVDLSDNGTTTFAAGTTVRGQNGSIGQQINIAGTQTLVNNGLISADVAGGTITITESAVVNNGTLQAINGGRLVLNSNVTGGATGQIVAGAGSTVIQNGVTISGIVNTSGGGLFSAISSAGNFLTNVTLNGNLDMASIVNSRERVSPGGLVLNGVININNNGILSFEGDGALTGNGTIVFGAAGPGNRVDLSDNGTTTFAAGTTVRGQNGSIGQQINIAGTQTLVNNGLISADVAGGTINILESSVVNNGILRAINGGTLVLSSNVTGGVLGQIVAGAGSTVLQNGVTISGIVNTSGGGLFSAISSSLNRLTNVTLNGNLDMATIANSRERVSPGGLVLNGAININNNGILSFEGDGTFSGNGTIVFGGTGAGNRVDLDDNGTTTFAAGTTVRGQNGTIGSQINVGGTQTLVNNGLISADVAGGTINILESSVVNNGTLRAINGGTLVLSSDVTGGATGQIVAGVGSTVLQNGVTISGIINTSGSGLFSVISSSNNRLTNVTLNGNLDMATIVNSRERVSAGGLVLNGAINLNGNGILSFEGDGTFSGNGTIVFGGTGAGNRVDLDDNGTTTFAAGTTVRGQNGTIGSQINVGGTQTLVNNGLISADVAGGTINILESSVVNNGTLRAINGGTLVLSSDVTGGATGQIVAGVGSTVLQNGVTISGIINTSGSGLFSVISSSNNRLTNVTLNGNLDMATIVNSRERVSAGGLVLNGAINLNGNGILSFEGDGTLSGNGSIVLGNTGAGNRIDLDGNGTTTFASGITVSGHSGTIGSQINIGGTQTLINNGTVNASVSGGTISFTDSALVNNGLVRASAGTLNVGVALSGTGTLQVDATGIMNLANGAKTQGTLAMGAAGAALNLGTGNLTLSSDYTNVGAASGNFFNRRAGVTGAGQIVAGGDAAQVLSGAGVSGGSTTNATLTIGSVRVGANSFNVNIGNSGSTGPSLRGALQTSVNGGNITDARLSGSGVTAGNYNAGAPGGAGSSQTITFTAASAGALAPLTGQTINLRSTFENIADQKLNIVLAGGAAAYNAAIGSAVPSPVVLANQRVGGSGSAALTISNTAVPGAFTEDLRATFASNTGAATNNGGIVNNLLAGASSGSTMAVGVDTSTAGAKSGSVTVNYQTTGTVAGVSNGLGLAGANAPQVVGVSGSVYQAASGALQTAPLNFGTIQVGQTVSQGLVVRNNASGAAGFVEDLNASFGASGNAQISGAGSLSGILAGNNSTAGNGTMTVTVNASTVGALNSSIAVNYFSAGAVAGVSNGLGTLAVGSEGYGVSGLIEALGSVINQASPLVNTPTINLGAVRVGAAAPTGAVSVSNVATVAPQAALNASMGSTTGPVTASGSFSLLNPGSTDNSSLVVALNTGTAGNFTGVNAGTATINLVSDASNVGGCAPSCTLTLAPQVVNVEGKVYTQAVGQLATTAVNFGVVRVGDTVTASNITINNTASATALNDTLRADLSGLGGPFSGNGAVADILAQGNGQLAVGLSTSTAGIFSQTGTVGFTSQNADMADVSAGADAGLSVFAQVNNLANGDFDLLSGSGTLSQTGTTYELDLGTLVLGSSVSSLLQLDNETTGPSDDLSGLFDLLAADDFAYGGWSAVSGLGAGMASGALSVNWMAGALGTFTDTIVFYGLGTNASDTVGLAQTRTLTIRASVIDAGGPPGAVPVPGTLPLLLAAAAAGWAVRRRSAGAKAGAGVDGAAR